MLIKEPYHMDFSPQRFITHPTMIEAIARTNPAN